MNNLSVDELIKQSLVWDNHGCMPLRPEDESFLPQLERYRNSGFNVASLNIGYDPIPPYNSIHMVAQFRDYIRRHNDKYLLLNKVDDIETARQTDRLAISFDIEGGNSLAGDHKMVELYYDLGVRWMLMAYNQNNLLGGGCQDDDCGLNDFGRKVITEMERVGMVVCCSHTGHRTVMDIIEISSNPVIFSHSNSSVVYPHKRNIPDDLIKACAETGGVIGINGIDMFLGNYDISTETYVRHLDHMVQLVGPDHVGISLDFVFDEDEGMEYMAEHPDMFPPEDGYNAQPTKVVPPERLPEIIKALQDLGYSTNDLKAILGGNHLRIAKAVWK